MTPATAIQTKYANANEGKERIAAVVVVEEIEGGEEEVPTNDNLCGMTTHDQDLSHLLRGLENPHQEETTAITVHATKGASHLEESVLQTLMCLHVAETLEILIIEMNATVVIVQDRGRDQKRRAEMCLCLDHAPDHHPLLEKEKMRGTQSLSVLKQSPDPGRDPEIVATEDVVTDAMTDEVVEGETKGSDRTMIEVAGRVEVTDEEGGRLLLHLHLQLPALHLRHQSVPPRKFLVVVIVGIKIAGEIGTDTGSEEGLGHLIFKEDVQTHVHDLMLIKRKEDTIVDRVTHLRNARTVRRDSAIVHDIHLKRMT